MKYLLSKNSTVTMRGKEVTASKKSGDWIYDTEEVALNTEQVKEIAKKNKIKVKGKKIADMRSSLNTGLKDLKVAEKNEPSTSEKITKIVKLGFEKEKTEDEMLIEIVQSGVKFKKAGKMMQAAMIELGLTMSAADRYKASTVVMEDEDFEPSDYSEIVTMAKKIAKELASTTESQAIAQIKKYCKENELEIPAKPKSARIPLAIYAMIWMCDHSDEEEEDFETWLDEKEVNEKASAAWMKKFALIKKVKAAAEE